ncbi:hypothetical protein WN51_03691 [Melipona quadrifasciata]|uniref:Uncharacterized protein n=1 Tax=Melipona quadrifasciata TaxID=166423 RepID=A0A0M8ZVT6_9HYME|nr:hypothetical protein WN51_03691 [Melipona quadrifasciata]
MNVVFKVFSKSSRTVDTYPCKVICSLGSRFRESVLLKVEKNRCLYKFKL